MQKYFPTNIVEIESILSSPSKIKAAAAEMRICLLYMHFMECESQLSDDSSSSSEEGLPLLAHQSESFYSQDGEDSAAEAPNEETAAISEDNEDFCHTCCACGEQTCYNKKPLFSQQHPLLCLADTCLEGFIKKELGDMLEKAKQQQQ